MVKGRTKLLPDIEEREDCWKHIFGNLKKKEKRQKKKTQENILESILEAHQWDNPGEEMTAGQPKRRLNGVCTTLSNGIQELHAEKRKNNLEISRWRQRMRPHIALDWDEAQKKAVARQAQVGIMWRNLSPFSEPYHRHFCMGLADVIIVPEELYDLKDIRDVLCYEVWQMCLSDSERKLLSEFLPKGIDAERVVQSLLLGKNFHFGNPLVSWGSSLCSGDMHPDAVRSRDFDIRTSKKAYYSELQNYHNNMLETLQRWKETWKSCKNPERELLQKIWRCSETKDAEHAVVPHAKENEDSNQNGKCVYESFYSVGEAKVHSNNIKHQGDNRMDGSLSRQGSAKYYIENLQETSEREEAVIFDSQKQETISSAFCINVGISKFLSCIKISRKQHADILKMKQTGKELQLESLGTILGDIQNLNVQSLSSFEEPDKKKMQQYWLLLIGRDIPAAYAKFVEGRLQRHICRKSLGKEFLESQQLMMYKGKCEENLTESRTTCNLKEGLQYNKETNLSASTDLSGQVKDNVEYWEQSYPQSALPDYPSGHVTDDVEDLEQSYPQSVLPDSASNSQNDYCSKTSNSSDMGEPSMGHSISSNKPLPVQTSNVCWSPSMDMASQPLIPQNAESAVHGSCMLENENPKPSNHAFLESKVSQNATSADREPVCEGGEMYSIKDVLSTADSETKKFHLQDVVGMTGRQRDGFLGKKRPNFWEPPKPTEEILSDIPIEGSDVRDELGKRTRFNLEKPGTLLNVEPRQIHTSQSRDQLAENKRSSFVVITDKKTTTEKHMLHLNEPLCPENPTIKLGMQPFDQRHDCSNPHALSLGMHDNFTHVPDLSLRQPEQLVELDHTFKLANERFEEQQRQHASLPIFSDHLSKNVTHSIMQSDGGGSSFISSPHVIQSRGRHTSLKHEVDQILHEHSLLSESVKGQIEQVFPHVSGTKQGSQFLADSKSTQQQCQFQHTERIQAVKEEDFNDHLQEKQTFRQSQHHENQPSVFHPSQQNLHFQHSIQQDLFPSGLLSAVVPTWCGPLQTAPCRPLSLTTIPQFSPQPGHWKGNGSQFHSSLCQPKYMQSSSISGHGQAGNNNEGNFFGMLPRWDRLPQSTYGTLNHDDHENFKNYVSSGSSSSIDCQGQDDWTHSQYSHENSPYSYPHEGGSAYRPSHIPWLNALPSTYPYPQSAHFRQQSSGLQDANGQGPSLKSSWNL